MTVRHGATIYALVDPRDNTIRYIGKTARSPEQRLIEHISVTKRKRYCRNWIVGLTRLGFKPIMRILEVVDESDGSEREIWWIRKARRLGWPLTNLTDGGEGVTGWNPSAETREKMRQSGKTKVFTPEHKAALSRGSTGKRHSRATKEKMSKASRGHKRWLGKRHSQETRAKMSKVAMGNQNGRGGKGKRLSVETRAKISASLTGSKHPNWGKKHKPETIEKMRKAAKARWQRERAG